LGLNLEAEINIKLDLSTDALPGQTTKTALTEEFMFQNVAYRPTNCINNWGKSAIFHSSKLPFHAEVAEKFLNGI
jgi:hypothetical protein